MKYNDGHYGSANLGPFKLTLIRENQRWEIGVQLGGIIVKTFRWSEDSHERS
jgi:hypothetical protein